MTSGCQGLPGDDIRWLEPKKPKPIKEVQVVRQDVAIPSPSVREIGGFAGMMHAMRAVKRFEEQQIQAARIARDAARQAEKEYARTLREFHAKVRKAETSQLVRALFA